MNLTKALHQLCWRRESKVGYQLKTFRPFPLASWHFDQAPLSQFQACKQSNIVDMV
jgi:hypothetical protein